jgi:hypothetical protein
MIESFYQALILTGIVIIAVLYYLKFFATNFFHILTEIIKMNEMNEYDPVTFVKKLEPYFSKLRIRDYGYYISFLDTEYCKEVKSKKPSLKKFIYTKDFTVYIEIVPGVIKWEKRYISRLLLETIFILVKSDVAQHLKSVSKAFDETNRINTFINHDMKNFVQFINILEHNLNNADSDKEKILIADYLKTSIPSLKVRSDRIMAALQQNGDYHTPNMEITNPYKLAEEISSIFDLNIKMENDNHCNLFMDSNGMAIIFENIIKNFYDKSIKEDGITLSMKVKDSFDATEIIFTDNGSPIADTEKIFEPFYTEKSKGLGIGLFHARNIAKKIDGTIKAENTQDGASIIVSIKKKEGRA